MLIHNRFRMLAAFFMAVIMACSLTACGDDDDKEPKPSDQNTEIHDPDRDDEPISGLRSVLIGSWQMFGDSVTFTFNRNGSGTMGNSDDGYWPIEWKVVEDLVIVTDVEEGETWIFRVTDMSQNLLKCRIYAEEVDEDIIDDCDGKDEYGYYNKINLYRVD